MSLVNTTDGPWNSRWVYAAGAMAQRFEIIIRKGRVESADVSQGMSNTLNAFARLSTEKDLPATQASTEFNNTMFLLAGEEIAGRSRRVSRKKQREITERLAEIVKLVSAFATPHKLDENELDLARRARDFFQNIFREGERAEYDYRMALEFSGPFSGD